MIKNMKEIYGDLFEHPEQYDIIVHGCNCFSTMGAGVAKLIKEKYPYAYLADKNSKLSPKDKLGKIVHTTGLTIPIIVNAYTQFQWRGKNNVDYVAIRNCMKEIKTQFSGKKIVMPKIGAGLAGGNWNTIRKIIEEELVNEDVTIIIK